MEHQKNHLKIIAVSLLVAGTLLIVVSFILPPTGQIDPSVIAAFGEIMGAAGIILGYDVLKDAMKRGVDAKVETKAGTFSIENPDPVVAPDKMD